MKGRNSLPVMKSLTADEAGGRRRCQSVASCCRGLVGEEKGGRMLSWGCQQRKEEEIRLEF